MEVHHHAHTARKRFLHYFWEFLMLFLAVFCGFLAEYQLEHKIEKDREKQYIKSLVSDLESDTTQLGSLLSLFELIRKKEDSLRFQLQRPDIITSAQDAYPYLGYPLEGYAFHRSERTIQQLKNAGGLRLIRSIDISNRINEYDESYHKSGEISQIVIETYHHYTSLLNQIAKAQYIGFPYQNFEDTSSDIQWLTRDPVELQKLLNIVINFQWVKSIYVAQLQGLNQQAAELISFLKKEYRLK